MTEPGRCRPVLRIELPGVVSWSRPRLARGGVRYPRPTPGTATRGRCWSPRPSGTPAGARRRPPATGSRWPSPAAASATSTGCARPSWTPCRPAAPCATTAWWTPSPQTARRPARRFHARTVVEVSTLGPRRPGSLGGAGAGRDRPPAHGPRAGRREPGTPPRTAGRDGRPRRSGEGVLRMNTPAELLAPAAHGSPAGTLGVLASRTCARSCSRPSASSTTRSSWSGWRR